MHPKDDGHQQDDGAGALQEDLGAIQQAQSERLHGGPAIARHFQQEGRLRALQHAGFQQARGDHRGAGSPAGKGRAGAATCPVMTEPSRLRSGMNAAINSA